MTVSLTAGSSYTFAVSNYNGSPNGSYKLKFTPPTLFGSASTDLGKIYSSGNATLSGTTLTVYLYGQTMTNFDRTLHHINVRILDLNGRAIHSGGWYQSFTTAGTWIPGDPTHDSGTWTFNLSGWDLSRASQLSISVGYSTF
jgi:hypothetical protein